METKWSVYLYVVEWRGITFIRVLDLADYNEDVKTEAVYQKSARYNSGVHGMNFRTILMMLRVTLSPNGVLSCYPV